MNKKIGIGIGVVALVLLLAGGAFTAVQLLTAQGNRYDGGTMVFEDVYDDGSGNPVTVKTMIEPSPNLPKEQPATGGIFLNAQDNSYFVGTGDISITAHTENGETSVSADHSGPKVEVIVGHDTIFYQDVTEIDPNPNGNTERHYVQDLRSIEKPDEIVNGTNIMVWGEQNGDRVIAKVIVLSEQE